MDSYRSIQNHRLKNLYDELRETQTFLTLKQICRLKVKQSIQFYPTDIEQLKQLPLTLQYYLSFDLLNPQFIQILLDKFQQVNGRVKPTYYDDLQFHEHNYEQINAHQEWEDQMPEDIDFENEEDDDNDEDRPVEKINTEDSEWSLIFFRRNMILRMRISLTKKDFIPIITNLMTMNGSQIFARTCFCV